MKRSNKWIVPRAVIIEDPRIPIARQIAWLKPTSNETEFSLPEPDHYNYAGLAGKPIDCPVIASQVFYQAKKSKQWWSVYYVTEKENESFLAWSEDIKFDLCWTPHKTSKMRQRRSMLWTRNNISEDTQTDNERLYTMGYYENLKSKYFNDDTTYVDSLLGEARATLKNFVPEEQSIEVDDFY